MIKGHAFIQEEDIYIRYESEDREELNEMKKSVRKLGRDNVTLVEDSENSFKIRINGKDKATTKRIIDLAGYKERIRSKTKVEKDLHNYLELKWP